MTNDELVRELQYLGVDPEEFRITMMLPLVQVAWADDVVQDAERALIFKIAERLALNTPEAERLLRGWLNHSPTEEYMRRGIAALRELAVRRGADGESITPERLRDLVSQSEAVAKAAGGLFGLFAIDAREKKVLVEIASALDPSALPPAPADDAAFPPTPAGAQPWFGGGAAAGDVEDDLDEDDLLDDDLEEIDDDDLEEVDEDYQGRGAAHVSLTPAPEAAPLLKVGVAKVPSGTGSSGDPQED